MGQPIVFGLFFERVCHDRVDAACMAQSKNKADLRVEEYKQTRQPNKTNGRYQNRTLPRRRVALGKRENKK